MTPLAAAMPSVTPTQDAEPQQPGEVNTLFQNGKQSHSTILGFRNTNPAIRNKRVAASCERERDEPSGAKTKPRRC
jgi:hypothetical protein